MAIITRFGGSGGGTPIVDPYPHVWECTVVQSGTTGVVSGVVTLEAYDILHYTMPLGFSTYDLMIGGVTYHTSFRNEGEMYVQWTGTDFVVVSANAACALPHVWVNPTYTITGSVLEITAGVDDLHTNDVIEITLASGESASVIEYDSNTYLIDTTIDDSQTNYVMFNGTSFELINPPSTPSFLSIFNKVNTYTNLESNTAYGTWTRVVTIDISTWGYSSTDNVGYLIRAYSGQDDGAGKCYVDQISKSGTTLSFRLVASVGSSYRIQKIYYDILVFRTDKTIIRRYTNELLASDISNYSCIDVKISPYTNTNIYAIRPFFYGETNGIIRLCSCAMNSYINPSSVVVFPRLSTVNCGGEVTVRDTANLTIAYGYQEYEITL